MRHKKGGVESLTPLLLRKKKLGSTECRLSISLARGSPLARGSGQGTVIDRLIEWGASAASFRPLPMFLADIHGIHINFVLVPSLRVRNLDIVPAHLPLSHKPVLCKGPVFQAIRPPPLPRIIMPLVPKLYCDLQSKGWC